MDTDVEAGIYALESSYLNCYVQVGIASGQVISVSFPDDEPSGFMEELPLLNRIDGYLDGAKDDFTDVDIALTVPTEHRSVLETVREIPYGEQRTVRKLTNLVPGLDPSREADEITVRSALAENPTPLLIPDHRVRDGPSAAPPPVEQRLRSIEGL
ncbi:MAG: MGMT family protein [Natronomonas sp.]